MADWRQVGAAAPDMLTRAAAQRWGVPVSSCRAEQGHVTSGAQRLSFGALAEAAQKLSPPAQVALKPPSAWKLIGKPTKRLDSPEKVTGRAQFGIDVRFPGLMTAVIQRSPVFGGKVRRYSADKALAVPGPFDPQYLIQVSAPTRMADRERMDVRLQHFYNDMAWLRDVLALPDPSAGRIHRRTAKGWQRVWFG